MEQNNEVENNVNEKLESTDLNEVTPVNSNKSEQLSPHNYVNENYNVHGLYDPNFNAGLSSYQKEEEKEVKEEVPVSAPEPTPVVTSPLLRTQAEVVKEQKVKKFIQYFKMGLSVIAIIVIIFFIYKFLTKEDKLLYGNLSETDSFFIMNSNKDYALFNENGDQLTEFIFDEVGNFYGGVAKVRDKDGRYGIIKENGEYLVELSSDNIYGNYSLYEVDSDTTNMRQIKNFNGEVISEGYYLDLDSYAYGAMFSVSKRDENYNTDGSAEMFNYAGISMGEVDNIEDYGYYSYDDSYVTLISNDKTILFNIDDAVKVIEVEGTYCIADSSSKTVILNSCSTWSSSTDEDLYKVVIDKKLAYTVSSKDKYLTLSKDGAVFARKIYEDYYQLLDDEGNVKQDLIIGYQSGKDYIVEDKDRLMFYKNNVRKSIVDCASYYQTASDDLYIIKVDRYADGCKDDINNQYTYYDLAGNPKSGSFYSAGKFNDAGRAVVSTDKLENYIINDSFEVLGESHYSMRSVGNLYIVWDERYNQALIDMNGKVLESVVESYDSYGTSEDDEAYIMVEIEKNKYVLYDAKKGKKIVTVTGSDIDLYKHYFTVDNNYYSYKTGKIFYTAD